MNIEDIDISIYSAKCTEACKQDDGSSQLLEYLQHGFGIGRFDCQVALFLEPKTRRRSGF